MPTEGKQRAERKIHGYGEITTNAGAVPRKEIRKINTKTGKHLHSMKSLENHRIEYTREIFVKISSVVTFVFTRNKSINSTFVSMTDEFSFHFVSSYTIILPVSFWILYTLVRIRISNRTFVFQFFFSEMSLFYSMSNVLLRLWVPATEQTLIDIVHILFIRCIVFSSTWEWFFFLHRIHCISNRASQDSLYTRRENSNENIRLLFNV